MHLPLLQALGQDVAQLINVALSVEPPGGLPSVWQQVLAHHRVSPLSEEARFAEVQTHKQAKGAPISEVVACLHSLQQTLLAQLEQATGLDGSSKDLIQQGLHRLVEEGTQHYRKLACERPKGMFAHVKATAHQHQYAQYKPGAYVLLCPTCGGPRLQPAHLNCEYCGGHFAQATPA